MFFLGMLKDSLRESLDRRSLTVMIVISTLFILMCASVGYEQVTLDKALMEMQGRFSRAVGSRWTHQKISARFEVLDIATVGHEPDKDEYEGGKSFRVRAWPLAEFQKLVIYSRAVENLSPHNWPQTVAGISEDYSKILKPPPDADLAWFIGAKLREHNFTRLKVEAEGTNNDSATFKVWLRPGAVQFLTSGWRLSILFGAYSFDIENTSIGDVVFLMQNTLAGFIAGWIGIIISLIATAAFVPNMVQKGTIDLLVARPIPRWQIYLYKYFGGLTYVVITAGYLIVGSWLVIALRSGIWSPGYLMSWPLLVFFFAAIYAVSALMGLLTRSSIAAILLSVVAWFGVSTVGSIHLFVHNPMADMEPDSKIVKIVDAAHAVLPRLKEVDQATLLCQLKANGITREHMAHLMPGAQYPEVQWAPLIGVTCAWMTALLALGCWRFSTRDF